MTELRAAIHSLADQLLNLFGITRDPALPNTATQYLLALGIITATALFSHLIVRTFFKLTRRVAKRANTHFIALLFESLLNPVSALFILLGIFTALFTLNLSPDITPVLRTAGSIATQILLCWLILRILHVSLDHLAIHAKARRVGASTLVPWLKKFSTAAILVILSLAILHSLGVQIKTFLAGLGLGGLALALAAQDTIANLISAVIIAMDSPFRTGETVQIGDTTGTIEEIGLRSIRIRTPQKTLAVIPNKTAASENIINLSRMTHRRVDQTLGLTYDTTPAQLTALLADIRQLLQQNPGISPDLQLAHFTALNNSSLDIQVIYLTRTTDFAAHLQLREQINLALMHLVARHHLNFAFPTQTLHLTPQPTPIAARP